MINNSALSMTMDVAQLAPKAATVQPTRGDGAFGEALAGAHSVHDRRESQQAAAPSRRDWARSDRSTERTTGQDRAGEVRSDAADRPARSDDPTSDQADATTGSTDATSTAPDAPRDDATTDSGDATSTSTTTTAEGSDAATDAPVDGEAEAATAATVAVAAAPVQADLDAIIVPTTQSAQTATGAVDAAIRMAINADEAAPTGVDAAMAVSVDGEVDVDAEAKLQTAKLVQGAEDAPDDDAQAGPTSPSASRSSAASGPSPAQLAAATFVDGDGAQVAPTTATTAAVAVAASKGVAEGDAPDAATQLVQAAAVEGEGVDPDVPGVQLKAAKAEAVATATAADADVVDADVPEAVQVGRLNQQQTPTVAAAAQHQAAVQAKAAEQAAQEGGDAAPAKAEPLPVQSTANSNAGAAREVAPGMRVREGLLNAHQQQRIDHIAEQLATRLRMSHAAGGSQVQLSLRPRELGDVTVQMQVREGVVAATVLVDKADTARSLQATIDDLKRSLEQQGLSIQQFSVDVRGEAGAGGANARAAAELHRNAAGTSQGSSSSVAGAAAVMPGYDGDDVVTTDDVHDGDVSVLA